jgi:hypothetical protein
MSDVFLFQGLVFIHIDGYRSMAAQLRIARHGTSIIGDPRRGRS